MREALKFQLILVLRKPGFPSTLRIYVLTTEFLSTKRIAERSKPE